MSADITRSNHRRIHVVPADTLRQLVTLARAACRLHAGQTHYGECDICTLVDTWERRFRAAGAGNIDVAGISAPQTSGPSLGTRWAREQVERVQDAAEDGCEAAHSAEDEALWDFVAAVAESRVAHPRSVAQELMAMGDIDFARRCA